MCCTIILHAYNMAPTPSYDVALIRGPYMWPLYAARIRGPYTRPLYAALIRGPYTRPLYAAPIRGPYTARELCCFQTAARTTWPFSHRRTRRRTVVRRLYIYIYIYIMYVCMYVYDVRQSCPYTTWTDVSRHATWAIAHTTWLLHRPLYHNTI